MDIGTSPLEDWTDGRTDMMNAVELTRSANVVDEISIFVCLLAVQ